MAWISSKKNPRGFFFLQFIVSTQLGEIILRLPEKVKKNFYEFFVKKNIHKMPAQKSIWQIIQIGVLLCCYQEKGLCMWFQGAAMIWCGLAMLGIMAIVLLTLAIIINHDVVIDVESHHLVLLFVYVIIAMIMISQGLSTFI